MIVIEGMDQFPPVTGDVVFRVEMVPGALEDIERFSKRFKPFVEPEVKLGTMRDSSKIAKKTADVRSKAIEKYEKELTAHNRKIYERASRDPHIGEIVAIGYSIGGAIVVHNADEDVLLNQFWSIYKTCSLASLRMFGWGVSSRDVHIARVRSWKHGIRVPSSAFQKGKWLGDTFVDLQSIYDLSARGKTSLQFAAKFLDVGHRDKFDFAAAWSESMASALESLGNDIAITTSIAERIGIDFDDGR